MGMHSGPAAWWTSGTNAGRTHIATKGIVQSGLVLNLDAGVSTSYPGTGTTWSDLSGQSNTGTVTGGATYSTNDNGTFVFDGVNDYVTVPHSTSLNLTTGVSASTWFKFTTIPTYTGSEGQIVFLRKKNAWQVGVYITDSNHYLFCMVNTASSYWSSPAGYWLNYQLTAGTWYNLTLTYTSANTSAYLNGALMYTFSDTTGNLTTNTNTVEVAVGDATTTYATGWFPGSIPTAHVYNRALSATEVLKNVNALRGRFGV